MECLGELATCLATKDRCGPELTAPNRVDWLSRRSGPSGLWDFRERLCCTMPAAKADPCHSGAADKRHGVIQNEAPRDRRTRAVVRSSESGAFLPARAPAKRARNGVGHAIDEDEALLHRQVAEAAARAWTRKR